MPNERPSDREPEGVERQREMGTSGAGERRVEHNDAGPDGQPAIAMEERRVEYLREEPKAVGKLDPGPWAELVKFLREPTLQNLGKVNYQTLEPRDIGFDSRLRVLAAVDPDVLRRVVVMRTKLANGIKLTQQEASELLEVLHCQSFPLSGLDINGYGFGRLNMQNAVVGKNFDASFVHVYGDNLQGSMRVEGDNIQAGMVVEGKNDQFEMRVGGSNLQLGMEVAGSNYQQRMTVAGSNDQSDMKVGDTNRQEYMDVGVDNKQLRMSVAEANFQDDMKVGWFNSQSGMKVDGSNYQAQMKVGKSNDQARMTIGGYNLQSYMKIGKNNDQTNVYIGVDNRQGHMEVGSANVQNGMVVCGGLDVRPEVRVEAVQRKPRAWDRLARWFGFGKKV